MENGISRVEIKDFLVFKGGLSLDLCNGVNVLIGENGSGKTTLMKVLYWACQFASESVLEENGNLKVATQTDRPFDNYFTLSAYFTNFQPNVNGR
jgi:predicted ATP-dependent endonuclease of OLD family